jgi:hypothetical protein
MYDTLGLFCLRHGITGGIKQMGTHSKSENGSGEWVALVSYPTHADTDRLKVVTALF